MKIRIGYIVFIVWLILAVLTYGMNFAYFQGRFPEERGSLEYKQYQAISIGFAALSPISTVVIYLTTGFAHYGLRYK